MFEYATRFDSPIEQWDVSTIKNMSRMFEGATNFNQPIGDWTTFSLTNTCSMKQHHLISTLVTGTLVTFKT
jgi:Mycoplasma protein of unknown function, DUF285